MGLDDLYAMCGAANKCELKVFMQTRVGEKVFITVPDFYIDGPSNGYMTHMTAGGGTVSNPSLFTSYHNLRKFTTIDMD